jgi:ribosomal-protein-alanine N-acetyltransferase
VSALIDIAPGDFRCVTDIMPVMDAAFDPAFGEAWTSGQCLGMLSITGSELLVARRNGTLVGFALFRTVFEESELLLIATHPDAQRLGVGASLAKAVIDQAANRGAKMVFLEVRQGNPALALYLRVGFLQVGQRENYYRGKSGDYFNALTLRYEITS